MAATDRELWDAGIDGNAEAFGVLFQRHARPLYNFAFRYTANWAAAEDAVSEVFSVAWRRRGEVIFTSETGSALPWLYGVASNYLRNKRRGERRASAAIARLDPNESQPDFSDEVVGRTADEAQMADVLAVVNQLPDHERDVIALCAWAGLDYQEAAIALDVPVGTIRSRLSRARSHLRELVEPNGHEIGRAAVTS